MIKFSVSNKKTVFFKENIVYPMWTCSDPIFPDSIDPMIILSDSRDPNRFPRIAFFNRCARFTLGCPKICVGCTNKKGFTKVHHKLVTLNR